MGMKQLLLSLMRRLMLPGNFVPSTFGMSQLVRCDFCRGTNSAKSADG